MHQWGIFETVFLHMTVSILKVLKRLEILKITVEQGPLYTPLPSTVGIANAIFEIRKIYTSMLA